MRVARPARCAPRGAARPERLRPRPRPRLGVAARRLERVDQGEPGPARLQPGAEVLLRARLAAALRGFDPREIPPAVWRLLAATGVAHGLYFYWMSRAFERGDLSVVYPIVRSTPALLPFIAVALARRVGVGRRRASASPIVVAGDVAGAHPTASCAGARSLAPGTRLRVPDAPRDGRLLARSTSGRWRCSTDAPWTGPLPRSLVYFSPDHGPTRAVFAPLAVRRVPRAPLFREPGARASGRAAGAVADEPRRLHADPRGLPARPGELRGGGAPGERALRGRDRRALAAASGRAARACWAPSRPWSGVALIALFPERERLASRPTVRTPRDSRRYRPGSPRRPPRRALHPRASAAAGGSPRRGPTPSPLDGPRRRGPLAPGALRRRLALARPGGGGAREPRAATAT